MLAWPRSSTVDLRSKNSHRRLRLATTTSTLIFFRETPAELGSKGLLVSHYTFDVFKSCTRAMSKSSRNMSKYQEKNGSLLLVFQFRQRVGITAKTLSSIRWQTRAFETCADRPSPGHHEVAERCMTSGCSAIILVYFNESWLNYSHQVISVFDLPSHSDGERRAKNAADELVT